jgi:hypothetical protein
LVKSQELTAFSQMSLKPLSKYNLKRFLHIPQAERKVESRNKRRETTSVLTDSPFKNYLTTFLTVRKRRKTTKRRLNTKLLTRLKKAHNDKESQSVTASEEWWRWSWLRQWIVRGKLHLLPENIFKLQSWWSLGEMQLVWSLGARRLLRSRRRRLRRIQLWLL